MIRRCARRVDAFWFAPTDPATLALVRVAFGALVTLWTLSLAPDLAAFFSTAGVIGDDLPRGGNGTWSLLWIDHSETAVAAVYLALLAGGVGILLGWHSRVCAAVVFVALTSLARANPYVLNSGDTLIRVLAFYLMLAPSGMEFSLDRRRARHRGHDLASTHPAWPLRLIQIQVSVMYASAVWSKLQGPTWRDGTAVVLRHAPPGPRALPRCRSCWRRSPLLAQLATYGTLVVESGLALLVWYPRTRIPALAAGVLLHLSIDASIRVGFFTLAVFVAYLSFTSPAWVRVKVNAAATLVRARRAPRAVRV